MTTVKLIIMNDSSTQSFKKETQKFAFVSRTFMFKVMECIYNIRVPNQIDDFVEDKDFWFNIDIPKSANLRSGIASNMYHGWFYIDISLDGLDNDQEPVIFERWYLIHLPYKPTETVPTFGNDNKENRFHSYRDFSRVLRSIYSLLIAMPLQTFQYVLNHLVTTKLHLVAKCSHFMKFPAKLDSYTEDELAKLKFGPVLTPIGRTLVICQHLIDISIYIPRPIRTAPHYSFSQSSVLQIDQDQMIPEKKLTKDVYGFSVPSTLPNMTPVSSVNLSSFAPHYIENFIPGDISHDNDDEKKDSPYDASEIVTQISQIKDMKMMSPFSPESLNTEFKLMKLEMDNLQKLSIDNFQ